MPRPKRSSAGTSRGAAARSEPRTEFDTSLNMWYDHQTGRALFELGDAPGSLVTLHPHFSLVAPEHRRDPLVGYTDLGNQTGMQLTVGALHDLVSYVDNLPRLPGGDRQLLDPMMADMVSRAAMEASEMLTAGISSLDNAPDPTVRSGNDGLSPALNSLQLTAYLAAIRRKQRGYETLLELSVVLQRLHGVISHVDRTLDASMNRLLVSSGQESVRRAFPENVRAGLFHMVETGTGALAQTALEKATKAIDDLRPKLENALSQMELEPAYVDEDGTGRFLYQRLLVAAENYPDSVLGMVEAVNLPGMSDGEDYMLQQVAGWPDSAPEDGHTQTSLHHGADRLQLLLDSRPLGSDLQVFVKQIEGQTIPYLVDPDLEACADRIERALRPSAQRARRHDRTSLQADFDNMYALHHAGDLHDSDISHLDLDEMVPGTNMFKYQLLSRAFHRQLTPLRALAEQTASDASLRVWLSPYWVKLWGSAVAASNSMRRSSRMLLPHEAALDISEAASEEGLIAAAYGAALLSWQSQVLQADQGMQSFQLERTKIEDNILVPGSISRQRRRLVHSTVSFNNANKLGHQAELQFIALARQATISSRDASGSPTEKRLDMPTLGSLFWLIKENPGPLIDKMESVFNVPEDEEDTIDTSPIYEELLARAGDVPQDYLLRLRAMTSSPAELADYLRSLGLASEQGTLPASPSSTPSKKKKNKNKKRGKAKSSLASEDVADDDDEGGDPRFDEENPFTLLQGPDAWRKWADEKRQEDVVLEQAFNRVTDAVSSDQQISAEEATAMVNDLDSAMITRSKNIAASVLNDVSHAEILRVLQTSRDASGDDRPIHHTELAALVSKIDVETRKRYKEIAARIYREGTEKFLAGLPGYTERGSRAGSTRGSSRGKQPSLSRADISQYSYEANEDELTHRRLFDFLVEKPSQRKHKALVETAFAEADLRRAAEERAEAALQAMWAGMPDSSRPSRQRDTRSTSELTGLRERLRNVQFADDTATLQYRSPVHASPDADAPDASAD